MGAAIYGQIKTLIGIAYVSYLLHIDDFIDSQIGVDKSRPITWDFGTGDTATGDTTTRTFNSPGDYDLVIRYYELGNDNLLTATRRIRIGLDTEDIGDPSHPYVTGGSVVVGVVKLDDATGARRLGFLFSPYLSAGTDDQSITGPADFTKDVDETYNLATGIERIFASGVLRYPVPDPEAFEEAIYSVHKYDVVMLGKSDALQEATRELKERLRWDYEHGLTDACPSRVFKQQRAIMAALPSQAIFHHLRPFGVLLPEGSGLRLAATEKERAFDNKATTDLTVGEQKEIFSPTEREDRERQEYSLGWLRGIIWDLSNLCYRYFKNLKLSTPIEPETLNQAVMAVLNCDDLSLSVRLYGWNEDDPYEGWEVWRHVATQVRFTPDPTTVGRVLPCHMYRDKTGDDVRVLTHDEAESFLGEDLPLDFKVIATPWGPYLLDPKRRQLLPLRGGGPLHALISTRGGGATTRPLPNGETFFLGSMVTVDGYAAPSRELQERWRGLVDKSEVEDKLIPEGVDAAYRLEGRMGLAGGQVNVYNLDPSDPAEIFCNIELGPKDFGRYETIEPGVMPFQRQQTGGFRFSKEATTYAAGKTATVGKLGGLQKPMALGNVLTQSAKRATSGSRGTLYGGKGAVDPSNWKPKP